MPVLKPPAVALIKNARFTAADLVTLREAIANRTATVQDAKNIAIYYADTLEPGVGSWLKALLRSLDNLTNVEFPIPHLNRETALLNGSITLPSSGRRHPAVRSVQRSLIALASRTGQLAYMLQYGADGDYGNETTNAIKTYQQRNWLPVTGTVDVRLARSLNTALQNTHTPGTLQATPADLAVAASELCTGAVALHYGVEQPWVNTDPLHNVPVGRPFGDLSGRWKCNLFGGNALRKGGYEPPYYGNRGRGEYPNANQWYKWSDRYAAQNGNRVHFKLMAEVPVMALSTRDAREAIAQLLIKIQPGDCLMQDHPGSQVADGGHTRIAIAAASSAASRVPFAQAQYERATIKHEEIDDFLGAEKLWLLRPTVRM